MLGGIAPPVTPNNVKNTYDVRVDGSFYGRNANLESIMKLEGIIPVCFETHKFRKIGKRTHLVFSWFNLFSNEKAMKKFLLGIADRAAHMVGDTTANLLMNTSILMLKSKLRKIIQLFFIQQKGFIG